MSNESIVEMIQTTDGEEKSDLIGTLYEQNSGLIFTICRKYSAYEDLEDLMQEAFFGLATAAEMYDPEQGSFLTYSAYWIRQAVTRYIENNGSVVRFPVHVRNGVIKYNKIVARYKATYGRPPCDNEIMTLLKINKKQLKQLKEEALKISIRSLDEPINTDTDDQISLGDAIADPDDQYEEIIEREDETALSILLWDEVDALTPVEAKIIRERFKENKYLHDIGKDLGISKEGVRKHQINALGKLKKSERILTIKDDYIQRMSFSGTGYQAFLHNGSRVERLAIDLVEKYDKK